jgi:BMFP domain-containing protein YqiC
MATDNRLFDDIARAANGALGALTGLRDEIEAQLRARMDSWLRNQNFVTRDEFEAVKAMAAKARMENDTMTLRVAELEKAMGLPSAAPRPDTE